MPTKINKYKTVGLLLGLFVLVGCLDPIELKIPKGFDETLIIQGVLVKGDPSVLNLSVSRLFDFTPESLTRVNVSQVILSDDSGNSEEIDRVGTGIYKGTFDETSAVSIEVGKSYKINIRTFDGRTYESTFEPIISVPSIESLVLTDIQKESVYSDGVTIRLDSVGRIALNTSTISPADGTPIALKWDLRRVFRLTDSPIAFGVPQKTCYITEDIDITSIKVFDGASVRGENLEEYFLFDQPFDFHLAEGVYLEVIQSSLSASAFQYWNQIRQVLEREGNMFEAPAGKIVTNFVNTQDPEEEVFGYFYATMADTARVYISPEFGRYPQSYCPPAMPTRPDGSCAVDVCCDCLSVEASTTIRPDFWVE